MTHASSRLFLFLGAFFFVALPALASQADDRLARGRYLANGVGRCFWCHSPLNDGDPATPRPETLGTGDVLDPETPVVAPNLTPDAETGLGRWSETEVVRAIREGVGRDGRALRGDHPSAYYSVMTDEDALAVVAYLRSLRPVRRSLPRSTPAKSRTETVQPPTSPAKATSIRTPLERGRYLVQLGECLGCHTTTTRQGTPFRELAFGGGRRFRLEKGFGFEYAPDPSFTPSAKLASPDETKLVASANITQDPSGIAFYTEGVFLQTIRTGRVAGVRALSSAMPWVFFKEMTDDDLKAVFAYLSTVPGVRHRVNNTEPPTYCPLCGRRHGLGELNAPVQR